MKYFLDTEFLEGIQKKMFCKAKPTIDLISIGIVSEDDREYYAISNEFNLYEAWNSWQYKKEVRFSYPEGASQFSQEIVTKEYWIRNNVLKTIYDENVSGDMKNKFPFTYSTMKWIISNQGKSQKQIAKEIIHFTKAQLNSSNLSDMVSDKEKEIKFYGYYADYDWVVFCWLFGKMIELPKGFPMYCRDLKQDLDYINNNFKIKKENNQVGNLDKSINSIKDFKDYPKQKNEHNALADAKWNKELYKFLLNF